MVRFGSGVAAQLIAHSTSPANPASLYRLRTLAQTGPRFYRVNAYMRRLEVLGLIIATAPPGGGIDNAQYAITEKGRAELLERYGELPPGKLVPELP